MDFEAFKIMRRASPAKKRQTARNAMREEYRFDYKRAKRNRFAAKIAEESIAVILDPDVAARFKSSQAVNAALRSVLAALSEAGQDLR